MEDISGKQIGDKEHIPFIKISQSVNKEKKEMQLEYPHFITPNKIMDI